MTHVEFLEMIKSAGGRFRFDGGDLVYRRPLSLAHLDPDVRDRRPFLIRLILERQEVEPESVRVGTPPPPFGDERYKQLFPFIGHLVRTSLGVGVLEQVFADRASVTLARQAGPRHPRMTFFEPQEVQPREEPRARKVKAGAHA